MFGVGIVIILINYLINLDTNLLNSMLVLTHNGAVIALGSYYIYCSRQLTRSPYKYLLKPSLSK